MRFPSEKELAMLREKYPTGKMVRLIAMNTLQNVRVECAEIPSFCFVNCSRLNQLTLSSNVKKICSHMINYCSLLREIIYEGSLADWAKVQKMQNWDGNVGGTTDGYLNRVQCLDGYMEYDRENRKWTEVRE